MLLLVHGWGFDSRSWDRLRAEMPEWSFECMDRGYFGTPHEPSLERPFLAITHSFGTIRMLRDPAPNCRGLIAINGFDCLVTKPGFEGVPSRVLDRMIDRFDDNPSDVLSAFRRRCGCNEGRSIVNGPKLREDLVALRQADSRADAANFILPILSIQGRIDPILPCDLADRVFASAPSVVRVSSPSDGHLLPLSNPRFCAEHIRLFENSCE